MIDAHVHLFPDRLFAAIWRWFDEHAWPIRYRLDAASVIDFLLDRGVAHVVALIYAHRAGMAADLNGWLAELVRDRPRVTALATVFPGEEGDRSILEDAFAAGLRGVKVHCHVQGVAADDRRLHTVWEACAERGLPAVVHAGREPRSPAYPCDPHAICDVGRVERVLRDHPDLRLCIPHLGADEIEAYGQLLDHHENLWLDTTMVLADYLPLPPTGREVQLVRARPDRILYGTDFPNVPYAWDREIKKIAELGLPDEALAAVLGGNAARLFGIDLGRKS